MNDNNSGNEYRVSTKRLAAASFITLAALFLVSSAGETQTGFTARQAGEKAERLLGKKPDHVDSYFSQEENLRYFAFTFFTESKWNESTKTETPELEEISIYQQVADSSDMRQLWQEDQLWPEIWGRGVTRYRLPGGFVKVLGQPSPCLRLSAYWGGGAGGAGSTRLGLYCISRRQLFWVDYSGPRSDETGVPNAQITSDNATEPSARHYLLSWGHQLGVDVLPGDPRTDTARRFQQLWIDANGRKVCSYEQAAPYRWKTWKTDQVDKLTPYTTRKLANDPEIVLEDGRYEWLSYPGVDSHAAEGRLLAGVGRYDKQLHQYVLLYVPASAWNYSKKIVVIGEWVYIQDCDRWAVRFNKVTRRLERGDFDEQVADLDTGVYPAFRSNSLATAGASPSTAPRSAEQEPAQSRIFIPPGMDFSAHDRESQRHDMARIVLANPDLLNRLNPLQRAVTICEAADLDRADQDACIDRALLDEQKRQEAFKEDSEDFKKRFLNVPHPSVGELRKMAHACNVVMWEESGHRSTTIKVPEGTEVQITWVSGTGNSEGKITSGNYVGRQILFMDSDLAPKSVGHK